MASKEPWWTKIDWTGAVGFVLALGVSASLVIGFLGAVISDHMLNAQEANVLATLSGAMVGAVATYLGLGRREQAELERKARAKRSGDE